MTENERVLLMALTGSLYVVLRHMIAHQGPNSELLEAEDYLSRAASQFLSSTTIPN